MSAEKALSLRAEGRTPQKAKGQLEGFVKGDRRDFLVGLGHASRATVGDIKHTYGATSQ